MNLRYLLPAVGFLLGSAMPACAQATASTSDAVPSFTLAQCIDYAMQHQPALKQSEINLSITRANNIINVSGWMPQLNASANLQHYIQVPTTIVTSGNQEITEKTGVVNTLIPQLAATQTIFAPSLLYAATSSHLLIKEAKEVIDSSKINLVSSVSLAFYNLLLTLQQIDVLKEDTVLFARNYTDAYHQYIGGIVDATDYEQAQISLNNAKAQLRQADENVTPQYAVLKQLMGYKPQDQFDVIYDTARMMKDIVIDTTMQLQYEKRIEYQQLLTAMQLQHKATTYSELAFLPSLSAYYTYNYEFENNSFPPLMTTAYPNSFIGLALNLPLSTGLSRIEGIRRSKMEEQLLNWGEVDLKAGIYAQYTAALGGYKSNLYNMHELQENVVLSKKVYTVVTLQYKQGIVPYLNVITAESNLISSEINYLNALFEVLSSKINLEKAMGIIAY